MPDLAAEWALEKNAGLGPDDVTVHSGKQVWWTCESCARNFKAAVFHRVAGTGCPKCASHGYDPTSPGYIYLLSLERRDLQQFGITNVPKTRLASHRRSGWVVLDIQGPADGYWVRETEDALKSFFRSRGVLLGRDSGETFDGYTESWFAADLHFSLVADMLGALHDWES